MGNRRRLFSGFSFARTHTQQETSDGGSDSVALPRKTRQLRKTFFLSMPAEEALVALAKLELGRFAVEFETIPAAGGCVVAVFSVSTGQAKLLGRFIEARQERTVMNRLASIGATAFS
jgi:hypothetical protein